MEWGGRGGGPHLHRLEQRLSAPGNTPNPKTRNLKSQARQPLNSCTPPGGGETPNPKTLNPKSQATYTRWGVHSHPLIPPPHTLTPKLFSQDFGSKAAFPREGGRGEGGGREAVVAARDALGEAVQVRPPPPKKRVCMMNTRLVCLFDQFVTGAALQ